MMKDYALNWYGYGGYTEMNDPFSNVNFMDEDESKCIIAHKNLLQNCYGDKYE